MNHDSPDLAQVFGDAAGVRRALHDMIRIRRFEEKCAELYSAGKIRGFLHLYIGEEAIAAGAVPELDARDAILGTYREHGHALVRGVPAGAIMAEMFGKQEGCSRGRGGSMHLFDASRRFFGGNAIVGGALPVATGFALADRLRGSDAVTACFFGEGAMAEGEFHEAANLAALWQLPVLFLCENNYYAMGTALKRSESQNDLCAKARSYRMEAVSVDGMDVAAVAAATRDAVARVRAGGGGDVRRVPHLPFSRAFNVRPRVVPQQGRGRALEDAVPDRPLRRARCCGRPVAGLGAGRDRARRRAGNR